MRRGLYHDDAPAVVCRGCTGGSVIVENIINVGAVIISEAALSFLGFGLPISVPSWGGMLSREGREFMEVAPRLALWPGLCLTIVVYCLNMFGDAVRDLLDPRLRGGGGRLGADGPGRSSEPERKSQPVFLPRVRWQLSDNVPCPRLRPITLAGVA